MRLPGPDYPAPAKLNLFLHVTGRRPDGYHLLQSVFTLIDRCDVVRIRPREDGLVRRVVDLEGVPEEHDLTIRAARELQRAAGVAQGADIELEKRIPIGGGLGGGSSDAATVLLALRRLWSIDRDEAWLRDLGARLGADVPFFLFGRSAWVEGIGERLTPLEVPARWYVVLVPPVEVATGTIFAARELTRNTEALKIEDFSAQPEGPFFRNDLEAVVRARYPIVGEHLDWLATRGNARMTGSGGCVFAGYESREEAERVLGSRPPSMRGFIAQGLGQHPLRGL